MGEWYTDHRGNVPIQIAHGLDVTMRRHGLSFPDAYRLLLGGDCRGRLIPIVRAPQGRYETQGGSEWDRLEARLWMLGPAGIAEQFAHLLHERLGRGGPQQISDRAG